MLVSVSEAKSEVPSALTQRAEIAALTLVYTIFLWREYGALRGSKIYGSYVRGKVE